MKHLLNLLKIKKNKKAIDMATINDRKIITLNFVVNNNLNSKGEFIQDTID